MCSSDLVTHIADKIEGIEHTGKGRPGFGPGPVDCGRGGIGRMAALEPDRAAPGGPGGPGAARACAPAPGGEAAERQGWARPRSHLRLTRNPAAQSGMLQKK